MRIGAVKGFISSLLLLLLVLPASFGRQLTGDEAALVYSDDGLSIKERNLQKSDEAYVALIYTDNFLLGIRVLGQSIRDTGTTRYVFSLILIQRI